MIAASLAACNGGKGGDTGSQATLTEVQAKVFSPSCGLSSVCHASPGGGNLILEEGKSYAELVGVPSDGTGDILVIEGDSANSYLMAKLNGDAGIAGFPMPQGGGLDPSMVQLVADWIDAGALDD